MIKFLLAKELGIDAGAEITQDFNERLGDAISAVKRLNNKTNTPMCYDQTLTGAHSYNQLLVGLSGGYQ